MSLTPLQLKQLRTNTISKRQRRRRIKKDGKLRELHIQESLLNTTEIRQKICNHLPYVYQTRLWMCSKRWYNEFYEMRDKGVDTYNKSFRWVLYIGVPPMCSNTCNYLSGEMIYASEIFDVIHADVLYTERSI